jgi:chemotaxis-related protein WspB
VLAPADRTPHGPENPSTHTLAIRLNPMLLLLFQIGHERVGLDIHSVREVVPRVRLQPLTGAPPWLAGGFVFRGRVVPVVDLHMLAGLGACPSHLSSRIILVPHGEPAAPGSPEPLMGLLASQVADLREIHPDPAVLAAASTSDSTSGLGVAIADGTGILRLLNPLRLLPSALPTSAGLLAGGGQ